MSSLESVSSWSGGKDSCLAYYRAVNQGYKVKSLVNFISRESQRCCFHGIEAKLMNYQAELIGRPLVQGAVTADMEEYEKEFKETVSGIKDITAMVFGDIYLDEHRHWVDRVCADIGISSVEPLWGGSPEDLAGEFIDAGFKAVVVSCQASKLGKEFIGRTFDRPMIDELKKRDVCPCGENGEFHTLVVDGPIFKRGIKIVDSEPVLKQGFWPHWFMDIKSYA